MLLIWVVLLLATTFHEGGHYLVLRRLRARPRPTVGILGPGWEFDSGHLSRRQLRLVWAAGPLAETLVWGSAATLAPDWAGLLLLLLSVQLLANTLLPGSDGWKLVAPRFGSQHRFPVAAPGRRGPRTHSSRLRSRPV
ncbi:MAG: hypothetical protein ACP5PW_01425 [Candidatus Dormibacteria bacterium]